MSEKKTIESNAVKILRAATWAAETAARATLDQLEAAGSKYVVSWEKGSCCRRDA